MFLPRIQKKTTSIELGNHPFNSVVKGYCRSLVSTTFFGVTKLLTKAFKDQYGGYTLHIAIQVVQILNALLSRSTVVFLT